MIRYSLQRSPGGRRYSSTDRMNARILSLAAAPDTLSPEAVAAMTDPDGIFAVVDVLFELESNRLRRPVSTRLLADGVEVTPGGNLATLTDGRRNSTSDIPAVTFPPDVTTANTPTVELTWTDPRTVTVVEVHGDDMVGQITAAAVDVQTTAGGTWTQSGTGGGNGRLAIPITPTTCYGIRVRIQETSDPSAPIGLVEVDPMNVLDVSDEVVELSVSWSRETDPGSSTSPAGSYEASELSLTLEDTAGRWNPAMNASLDIGHRVEVAAGVRYTNSDGVVIEELLPAGVFYTEPFDTDSEATTVSIKGTDRLARNADVAVEEDVRVDVTVDQVIRDLALKYLDLGSDQVMVASSIGSVVIPYAYASGPLGSYLADIAKATGATLHVDAADRLVLARRTDAGDDVIAEIRSNNALISHKRPPGYDVTTSIVSVTAAPLTMDPTVTELWAMPSGGISIPVGGSYKIVAPYGTTPAANAYLGGIVADGQYGIPSTVFSSDRAVVVFSNDDVNPIVIADARISGNPLIESSIIGRAEHVPSINRYGPRELAVSARLIQTQAQADAVAEILLDSFRSLDDAGMRRLPDVSFEGLGILHAENGDRILLVDDDKGLGSEYVILARTLSYTNDGALLFSDVRCRDLGAVRAAIADVSILDDVYVAGY